MINSEYLRWKKDGGPKLQLSHELNEDSVVVDIGLYTGSWTKEIASRYNCYVYGFEPIPAYYKVAKESLSAFPKVKVFNYGLGARSGQFLSSVFGDASSMVMKAPNKNSVVVSVYTPEILFNSLGLTKVDLASINIEGGEYNLLDYMIIGGLIKKFSCLMIQFHEVNSISKPIRVSLRKSLLETHNPVYIYDTVWDYWKIK